MIDQHLSLNLADKHITRCITTGARNSVNLTHALTSREKDSVCKSVVET